LIEADARGLVAPRDLSLVGFNDADYSAFLRPSLTTIRMPRPPSAVLRPNICSPAWPTGRPYALLSSMPS